MRHTDTAIVKAGKKTKKGKKIQAQVNSGIRAMQKLPRTRREGKKKTPCRMGEIS